MSQTRGDKHDQWKESLLSNEAKSLSDEKEGKRLSSSSVVIEIKTPQQLINASRKAKTLRKRLKKISYLDLWVRSNFIKTFCCLILMGVFLGISGVILGTTSGIDAFMLTAGVFFLGVSIGGGGYGIYRFSNRFLEIRAEVPYRAILRNDEQEYLEAGYHELKLELKSSASTKEIFNQLLITEKQLIGQDDRMLGIEKVFNYIEHSIGFSKRTDKSLFTTGHPARDIILSYLFGELTNTESMLQMVPENNQSVEDNQSDQGNQLSRASSLSRVSYGQ
jgi:hypothetical protein